MQQNWQGWFIEQSFDNQSIFETFKTIKMKAEEENWKEHVVEIPEDKLNTVIDWLTKNLKSSWYAHLIRGNEIVVVYRDKAFKLKEGESFVSIADYGRQQGVAEDQLPNNDLFKLARDNGF